MFEIGSSLREARLRQGLDFPELEQATKIRGKYLRALEDEQFDVLPAQTYVKGFLRNYAEYLGLDGQLYVDEYNSRYVLGEDAPLPRPRRSEPQRRGPHVESRVVLLTVLGIALVTGLVIVAWRSGSSNKNTILGLTSTQTSTRPVVRPKPRPTAAHLRTLEKGERQLFVARRLWIHAGRPEALSARLNGRLLRLPSGGVKTFLVTARGLSATTGA
ncbi:MAG: helix-turn-helix domain-containing protein [Actinobacteria bacterium]|nr:MAG: helix-turn-helix domain-containing protein [Actinomycetota bacterium]